MMAKLLLMAKVRRKSQIEKKYDDKMQKRELKINCNCNVDFYTYIEFFFFSLFDN